MQIEVTINKWFDQTWALLQKKNVPNCRIDVMILGALPIIDNYLNSALLILKNGSKLPAMALLRSTGELFTRIICCLKGNNTDDQDTRLRRWEKHSLIERKKLYEKFLNRYKKRNDQLKIAEVQQWIENTNEEIGKITTVPLTFR